MSLDVGGAGFRPVITKPGGDLIWYAKQPSQSSLSIIRLGPEESVRLYSWRWGLKDLAGNPVPGGEYWAGGTVSLIPSHGERSNTIRTVVAND